MVKMTLDFSTSYRAITNADLGHTLVRQAFSWDGQDIPIHQVTMTSSAGDYVIPASTFVINAAYDLSHSASTDHFDFYSQEGTPDHPFLRFAISVNGPPLCENFVQATYANNGTGWAQYATDKNTFDLALVAWVNYMLTNQFKASSAALTDDGGLLGEFSSDIPTLVEDFVDPTEFFSSIIIGSDFDDHFAAGSLSCTLYGGLTMIHCWVRRGAMAFLVASATIICSVVWELTSCSAATVTTGCTVAMRQTSSRAEMIPM